MTPAPGNGDVLVGRRDTTLVITINRPRQRNAVTLEVARYIAAALDTLDAERELTGAVITGAGGAFCAGMDLKRFGASGERPWVPTRGFAGIVEQPPVKPLIAAVEGWALGGGFEIALACDLIVAGRGARFGLPEVRRGLVARGGGLFRLPRALPRHIALEMVLTGAPIDAETAYRHGLLARLVEDGAALESALGLAAAIARNAPLAVAASKRVLRESLDWPEDECFERQRPLLDPVFDSEDAREGAAAFGASREPVWTGR
jgi:enoyl-CoA hydratase